MIGIQILSMSHFKWSSEFQRDIIIWNVINGTCYPLIPIVEKNITLQNKLQSKPIGPKLIFKRTEKGFLVH